MKIDARYLLEEPELGDAALPDSLELDLPIDGDRVLGEVYLPAGVYEGPHPTMILCHGIPGTNNNDDVAQCLRRMGCVVIRPYHRGAWGSEGIYSFSHCIEDAIALAHWAREDVAKAYDIDPKNIFLAGHSNGGNTVLNASRYLPFLRGVIAFCPYDHQAGLEHIATKDLKACFQEAAAVLHVGRFEDLWQDSVEHASKWSFAAGAHRFQDRNLLLIGGRRDTIAPPHWMIEPLWRELEALPTESHHKKVLLDTNHGLDNARLELVRTIGQWIQEVVED
jgi:pimeloyl-ACP methyl ester carboxylesterase